MFEDMLSGYGMAFVFMLFGIAFVLTNLILSRFLRPSNPTPDKLSTYECGERILGPAWIRYNIRFYQVALVFIIFDVEVAFLYPCAVVFRQMPTRAFLEVGAFVGVLLLGLIYLWVKGDLEWIKSYEKTSS